MDSTAVAGSDEQEPEPRWQAVVAIIAASGLYFALPANLTVGPWWLFPATIGLLLVPAVVFHRAGRHHLDRRFGYAVNAVMTMQMAVSVTLLIRALPARREAPTALLLSATALWRSEERRVG